MYQKNILVFLYSSCSYFYTGSQNKMTVEGGTVLESVDDEKDVGEKFLIHWNLQVRVKLQQWKQTN